MTITTVRIFLQSIVIHFLNFSKPDKWWAFIVKIPARLVDFRGLTALRDSKPKQFILNSYFRQGEPLLWLFAHSR